MLCFLQASAELRTAFGGELRIREVKRHECRYDGMQARYEVVAKVVV